jgi:predicted phage tail protein
MLREIRVYGRLAKFLGRRVFRAEVATAAEAVRFLLANFPQLEKHMADQHYRVSVGGYDLSIEEIHDPAGQQQIKIVPVLAGAGTVGRIIAGVALLAIGFLVPGSGALRCHSPARCSVSRCWCSWCGCPTTRSPTAAP